jgi:hypothetical protein
MDTGGSWFKATLGITKYKQKAWGCGSSGRTLPIMLEVLGSISGTVKKIIKLKRQ